MFMKKYWLPLSVCLVVVVSVGLYLQATHPPPEPIKIYKPVEPLATPTQAPTTQTPVGEKTEQGGHWHGDEWHAEPHTPQTQNATHTEYGHAALSPEVAAGRKSETPTPTVSVSSRLTVEPPTDLDDEAAWDAYIHALDPDAKEPADVFDKAAWDAYSKALEDERRRLVAFVEALSEQLRANAPRPPTRAFRDYSIWTLAPYNQAISRLDQERTRRLNQWQKRLDAMNREMDRRNTR